MTVSMYYPQSALEGFGRAIAAKLGDKVEFRVGAARTDGKVIYLPEIRGAIDRDKFNDLCATACHEAAHVYYKSCPRHKAFANGDPVRAAVYNAVLDVADEARLGEFIPTVAGMFGSSNALTYNQYEKDRTLANAPDRLWAVLVSALLDATTGKGIQNLLNDGREFDLAEQIARLLYWKCRRKERMRLKSAGNMRTNFRWKVLDETAEKIVELVKQAQANGTGKGTGGGNSGGEPQPGGEHGGGGKSLVVGVAQPGQASVGDGSSPSPGPDVVIAVAGDGQDLAEGNQQRSKAEAEGKQRASQSGHGGAAGQGANPHTDWNCAMSEEMYRAVLPSIRNAVTQMAESEDADGLAGGFCSGSRIDARKLYRATMDGRCFARREAEGENLHACVLLDTSGSMSGMAAECMAVAQAFVDSITPIAESVKLVTFGVGGAHAVDSFRKLKIWGGTPTGKALAEADNFLCKRRGRKVVVCITDGDPDNFTATADTAQTLMGRGVEIIGIAYRVKPQSIQESMPGALIVTAENPCELATKLTGIGRALAAC